MMLTAAKELIIWASKLEILVEGKIEEEPPQPACLEALNRLHPDLAALYTDHSGIYINWNLGPECRGRLDLLPPDQLLGEGDPYDWNGWRTDEDLLCCVVGQHDDPKAWLPTARSLVPFLNYHNGDALCVSQIDRKIYYQDHEEGELIYVAANLNDFYRGWSKVRFAEPNCRWRDVGLSGGFPKLLFDLPEEPDDLAEVRLKDLFFRTTRKLRADEVRKFVPYFETSFTLVQLKRHLDSGDEIALVRRIRENKLGEHLELLKLIAADYRVVDSDFGKGFAERFSPE